MRKFKSAKSSLTVQKFIPSNYTRYTLHSDCLPGNVSTGGAGYGAHEEAAQYTTHRENAQG